MPRFSKFALALLLLTFLPTLAAPQVPQVLAKTPPMGWNSWDAYGLTIDEAQYRDNVKVLAGLKQYGWQYAIIDEGWYMQDPFADTVAAKKYVWDDRGQLVPAVSRFPSAANGAGFKPLADWVHAQGLKFGIHIIRGIPKDVVKLNLPIGGGFHAQDAADIPATCPWDEGNYGVSDTPAGQAYYDAMFRLFSGWGLDYIKVDCVSDHPYRPTEIRQIAEAIRKTGRPIVLSLSPGPTQLEHAAEVAKYAQMWRITDDHWDYWAVKDKKSEYPFALSEEFDRIAAWNKYVKPGNWPDPDMLPEGSLTPHPGEGQPRHSRYTPDEQRTEFNLWAISRSPLIFGGNLTKLDDESRELMTDPDLVEVDQKAIESHPVTNLPTGFEKIRVWAASENTGDAGPFFMGIFNLDDEPVKAEATWAQLGITKLKVGTYHCLIGGYKFDLRASQTQKLMLPLPAHGSAVCRVQNSPPKAGK